MSFNNTNSNQYITTLLTLGDTRHEYIHRDPSKFYSTQDNNKKEVNHLLFKKPV